MTFSTIRRILAVIRAVATAPEKTSDSQIFIFELSYVAV